MPLDRISKVRVGGLRAIDHVTLDVHGLVALIGDNGSGKSCIVEALQILSQASKPLSHVPDIIEKRHGGLRALLRHGASELSLGVTIEGAGPAIDYDFKVAHVGTFTRVVYEAVTVSSPPHGGEPLQLLFRETGPVNIAPLSVAPDDPASRLNRIEVGEQGLALPWVVLKGLGAPEVQRVSEALSNVVVHVPFETRPTWQHAELNLTQGPRWPAVVEQANGLERYGRNLANAFQALRNRGGATWQRVLDRARLGLGHDLREFSLAPVGRGQMELQVLFGAFPDAPFPTEFLSEGQLAYLCFVALMEFHSSCSLLVFDEPEVHLHPQLLARVAWMMEEASATAPVLIATHSNQFLDALESPGDSARLCELDEHRRMLLRHPDRSALKAWLEDYNGLGSIRAAGYEQQVFASPDSANGAPS